MSVATLTNAISQRIRKSFDTGDHIFRMIPVFVPRRFSVAGRRLRLHPNDYFALGTQRGAIKERWFSSVIRCMNGPLAAEDEGLSYCEPANRDAAGKFTLRDAVEELGPELIGEELIERFGGWPMYSKFFDFGEPLFFHLHLSFEDAARVGMLGKPEAYYFPPQLNNHPGTFPHTYFGFCPEVTRDMVRERLVGFKKGDTRITELSRAYRIELSTGWYTPPGVLHAPGSYLTYEPQWNSDVNSVYENVVGHEVYPYEFLVENCPDNKKLDVDYVLDLMDWEKNIDPDYRKHYFRPPIVCRNDDSCTEKWITYGNDYIAAQELTVHPGQTATVEGPVAYGCVIVQGHGKIGSHAGEAATMLRFGQQSGDEYFVSEQAAQRGVTFANASPWEPLVVLKHFGPNHPDTPLAPEVGEAAR